MTYIIISLVSMFVGGLFYRVFESSATCERHYEKLHHICKVAHKDAKGSEAFRKCFDVIKTIKFKTLTEFYLASGFVTGYTIAMIDVGKENENTATKS